MRSNKSILIMCNTLSSLALSCTLSLISIAILDKIINQLYVIMIYIISSIIIAIPIWIIIWKKCFKKGIIRIIVDGKYMIYDSVKEVTTIDLDKVVNVKIYRRYYNFFDMDFEYYDGNRICITNIWNKYYRFIKKKCNKIPSLPKKKKKITLRTIIIAFKDFIIDYKDKIITSIIGLALTTISIILYVNVNNKIVIGIGCAIICFGYGVIEIYFSWIKKYRNDIDKLSMIVGTCFFTIVYHAVVFTALVLLICAVASKPFSIDILFYTIFSFPSFVIVIALILFILACIA